MMPSEVKVRAIKNLREKVILAVCRQKNIKDRKEALNVFLKRMNISSADFRRYERCGIEDRTITKICQEFSIAKKNLVVDLLFDFSRHIGFMRHEMKEILGFEYVNFDFYSREYKYDRLKDYFHQIDGIYELWHYSMSKRPYICKSVFYIDKMDERRIRNITHSPTDAIIRAKILYDYDDYAGPLIIMRDTMVCLMDSMKAKGELVTLYVSLPPPETKDFEYLYGVSIGFDTPNKKAYSTRVILRKIGDKKSKKQVLEEINRKMSLRNEKERIMLFHPNEVSEALKLALRNVKPDSELLSSGPPSNILEASDFPAESEDWENPAMRMPPLPSS